LSDQHSVEGVAVMTLHLLYAQDVFKPYLENTYSTSSHLRKQIFTGGRWQRKLAQMKLD
jgi:hypothetical protein